MDAPERSSARHASGRRLLGAAALVLVSASTLEVSPFRGHLWLRALCLAAGALPAALLLKSYLPTGRVDESNHRRFLVFVVAVHVLATLYVFPPGAVFDSRPFVTVDHSIHYAQCVRARDLFWKNLRTDSYSPYFMAGYPAGTIFDVDMKGAELFCSLVPLPTAVALKVFVIGAYLTLVVSIFVGARMLGFGLEESAIGLVLFLVYWHWGRPYAGDFRYVGMFSFVLASHLSLLLAGFLRRFLLGSARRGLIVLGSVTFLVHVSTLVMVAAPAVTVLAVERARLRRRAIEGLVLCVLVVALVNVLWLKPVIEFLPEKIPTRVYYQLRGLGDLADLLAKPAGVPAVALLLFAALGTAVMWRMGRGRLAAPCAVGTAFLIACAAYGVYMPGVDQMEPGRFLVAAMIFAAPLAGAGGRWLLRAVTTGPEPWRARLGAGAIVALTLGALPLSLLEAKAYYRHTVSVSFTEDVDSLCAAIEARVHPGARLMIEDASASAYGGVHLPALLPLRTHVEQIGGPYPHTPLRHYRTSFTSDAILGTPVAAWEPANLRERLDFLRVRWIVTATPTATDAISALPAITRVWHEGTFSLWEMAGNVSPEPELHGTFNRIDVTFHESSTGVVLPYHWVEGLHAAEPAEIVPVLRYDDPVPYVYLRPGGLEHVEIIYR